MKKGNQQGVGRRRFIKAAGGAAGLSLLPASTVFGTQANSQVRLAVTGCGHRGEFVGTLFEKHTNTKVVALHDYFQDRVDRLGEKLKVEPGRRFTGLNGYKRLFADDVDVVAVMSPPFFHPQQSEDVLAAGKHLYLSKPIAVDVPGCRRVQAAAEKAKGQLSILVDFQTRANALFKEAAQRVHQGDIGSPVLGQVYYQAGRLSPKASGETPMARLRNWVFDIRLSGDIIVEQNVHVIDVANWYLRSHPVRASGGGGRKARTDVGDCWDHYVVTYTYPDDVLVDFSSGQYLKGFDDLCIRLFGSQGTVDSHYSGPVSITGDKPWPGGSTEGLYTDGTVNNIVQYHASLTEGKPLYDTVEPSVTTIMTGILGRMTAYEGREVSWEEMAASKEVLEPDLDLPTNGAYWTPEMA